MRAVISHNSERAWVINLTTCTLQMAFHGIGSLPIAVIKRSQENVEAQVQKDMLIHAQRLEALFCPPKISPPHSASSSMTELPTIPELA